MNEDVTNKENTTESVLEAMKKVGAVVETDAAVTAAVVARAEASPVESIDCQGKAQAECCPETLEEGGPTATNACCTGVGDDTCKKED